MKTESALNPVRIRRRWIHGVAAAVAVVVPLGLAVPSSTGASGIASLGTPCGVGGTPHYDHVVWIVMENVGYSVVSSASAPFLHQVAAQCGLATNDVAVSHPSLPNYLAMTSGSTDGVTDDAEPSTHRLTVTNIFSQLSGNWRAFNQSMPVSCDRVTGALYATRHNPAVYYRDLGATCQRNDVALAPVITLSAAFTFITPNICDDLHSCPIATGDAWLAKTIPMITNSALYRSGRLVLFITFDENATQSTNRVPLYVVAPTVPRGLRVGLAFTHYSLLRSTESLLGLAPLRHAASARSLLIPFHLGVGQSVAPLDRASGPPA